MAGWTSTPLAAPGCDIQHFEWIEQIYDALRERGYALGLPHLMRLGDQYENGTTGSISLNSDGTWTMTDSAKAWAVNHWIGAQHGGSGSNDQTPTSYDLVLDKPDPRQVVRCHITSNTASTLTLAPFDETTPQKMASVFAANYTGCRYYIVANLGGDTSPWWDRRILQWGNPPYADTGIIVAGANAVQEVKIAGTLTAGTFTLTVETVTTPAIDWNATLAAMQSAMDSAFGTGNVTVGGTLADFTLTFSGGTWAMRPVAAATVASSLTGATGITVTTTTAGVVPTTTTVLSDATKSWTVNGLAGKHLIYSDGIRQRRALIGSNTATTVTYGAVPIAPIVGSKYAITSATVPYDFAHVVGAGQSTEPGRPFLFANTPLQGYYTHDPFGNVTTNAAMLAATVTLHAISNGAEADYTVPCVDADVWSNSGNTDPLSTCFTPYLYRTLRGLQVLVENSSVLFCPNKDWTGSHTIYNYVPALILPNQHTATVTGGCGTITGLPYFPIDVQWAMLDNNGTLLGSGIGTSEDGTFTATVTIPPAAIANGSLTGNGTLIVSPGWTRSVPRTFRHVYDRTAFYPDVTVIDEAQAIVDPPTTTNPGKWITRNKSTAYKVADARGFVSDSTLTMDAFATNDLARYDGDNRDDPAIFWYTPATSDPLISLTAYMDKYVVAKDVSNNAGLSTLHGFGDSGTVSTAQYNGANCFSMTDISKNWWRNGVMIIHTGTATAGSTTSLTDAGGDVFWTGLGQRSDPTMYRFVNFVIEMQVDGPQASGKLIDETANFPTFANGDTIRLAGVDYPITSNTPTTITFTGSVTPTELEPYSVTYHPSTATATLQGLATSWAKRFITGHNGTTVTWANPLPISANGLVYRIREPSMAGANPVQLNYWLGKVCQFTSPAGATTATIIGNDDTTLYFTTNATPAMGPGWTYSIIELETGLVYRWDGSAWQSTDIAGQPLKNQRAIAPSVVTRYGRFSKGDYVTSSIYNELQASINLLTATQYVYSWVNPTYTGTPSDNTINDFDHPAIGGGASGDPTDLAGQEAQLTTQEENIYNENDGSGTYSNGVTVADGYNHTKDARDGIAPCATVYSSVIYGGVSDGTIGWPAGTKLYDANGPGISARRSKGKLVVTANLSGYVADFYGFGEVFGYPNPDPTQDGYFPAGTTDVNVDTSGGAGTSFQRQVNTTTFNNYGNQVLYRKWDKFDTVTGSAGTPTYSKVIGGDTSQSDPLHLTPVFPTMPDPLTSASFEVGLTQGFAITQAQAVIRWNVAGGMTYI